MTPPGAGQRFLDRRGVADVETPRLRQASLPANTVGRLLRRTGIEVEAEVLATGQVASFTESRPDGSYHIGGLPAGTYVIIAIDDDMVYAEE